MKSKLLTLLLSLVLVQSAYTQSNSALDGRLKSVRTLIENSSGARQIQASGNAQANQRQQQARDYYRQAEQARRSGNQQATEQALLQATKAMLEAVRMANPQGVVGDKKRRDFQSRLDSVNALLSAHARIAQEKGNRNSVGELRRIVDNKIAKAQSMMNAGQLDQARQVLDQTYVATKTAIEQMRGGDTLVRSLNFANKAEEYRYELDRNDTHRMLVTVLLEEKMQDPKVSRMVNSFMHKANQLRAQAEQQAAGGNYANAVRTLEAATKEVVRAIRGAGIYIPG